MSQTGYGHHNVPVVPTGPATVTVNRFPSKPSPLTGGWLPENSGDRLEFIGKIIDHINKNQGDMPILRPGETPVYNHKSIKDLHALIEDSALLSMLFRSMFEEIPFSHRFDILGRRYDIINYEQLLAMFDKLLDLPPMYNANMMVALPFTLLLEWPMATRGGLAAFLNEKLNVRLGAVLDEWGVYLADPLCDSNSVVINNNSPNSWLCNDARKTMQRRDPKHRKFEDLYKCDPADRTDHLGFRTWDEFFTRQFADGVREVEDHSDDTISNGCESSPYAIKQKVKVTEKFWIKGQPYSLKHMLNSEKDAKQFAGGTVYQAFLSPLTYHRWHSPINGTITKLRLVKGSYFSVSPINAFPDPETFANTQSQAYITSVATRALIYLNNSTVGDMVMIAVGMVEVSTCEFNKTIMSKMVEQKNKENPDDTSSTTWVPKSGKSVTVSKGDELGMFHFGGSTHCLVFGPNVHIKFWKRAIPQDSDEDFFVPLNATIADIEQVKDGVMYPDYY